MNRQTKMDRQVYLSIDDVGPSLRYLTRSRPDSLFDMRFYEKLREYHMRFGAGFCLYCFSRLEDFAICEIPERYAEEFRENGEWLRFGFHGRGDTPFYQTRGFREEFALFRETARRLDMAGTDILRVHCWRAAPEQSAFLREQGIHVLLSPDRPDPLHDPGGVFFEDGLEHWPTGVRFEALTAVNEETLRIGAERVVAFTHEWAFEERAPQIEEALALYKRHGYELCCVQTFDR